MGRRSCKTEWFFVFEELGKGKSNDGIQVSDLSKWDREHREKRFKGKMRNDGLEIGVWSGCKEGKRWI